MNKPILTNLDIEEISQLAKTRNAQINLIFEPECIGVKVLKNDWWANTYMSYKTIAEQRCGFAHMVKHFIDEFIEKIDRKEK